MIFKENILPLNMLSLVVEFTLKIEIAISKNRNDSFALVMLLMESLHATLQHTYDINLIFEPCFWTKFYILHGFLIHKILTVVHRHMHNFLVSLSLNSCTPTYVSFNSCQLLIILVLLFHLIVVHQHIFLIDVPFSDCTLL